MIIQKNGPYYNEKLSLALLSAWAARTAELAELCADQIWIKQLIK